MDILERRVPVFMLLQKRIDFFECRFVFLMAFQAASDLITQKERSAAGAIVQFRGCQMDHLVSYRNQFYVVRDYSIYYLYY